MGSKMTTKTIQKQKLSEGLKKRFNEANKLVNEIDKLNKKAGDVILDTYNYAVDVDHYSPQEARQILYDNLSCSKQWIRQFLPEEAKMMSNSRTNNNQTTTTEEEEESYDTTPVKWNEKRKRTADQTDEEFQKDVAELFNYKKPGNNEVETPLKNGINFAKQILKYKKYPRYAKIRYTMTDGKLTFRITNL